MDLSKLSKDSLEDILSRVIEDLEDQHSPLSEKYSDMICDELYGIDEDEAMDIVKGFKPYGEVYSWNDIETTLSQINISSDEYLEYYLCMNMFYNDFKTYAESRKLDIKDFCYNMSKLFINDIDAPKYKVAKYFNMFE